MATGAIAAAVVVPTMRRRLRARPAVAVGAAIAGPPALAILKPRTQLRDVAIFTLQMWGFMKVHEMPYDDPDRLRRRLKISYPITVDRLFAGGRLPNAVLQEKLGGRRGSVALSRVMSATHWAWFFEPYAALIYMLISEDERFPRAARQMAATYDIGCAMYVAVPTAPPWWASENGYTGDDEIRRLMEDVGRDIWGPNWDHLYEKLGSNPWAAMPSLHFATSLMAALLLSELGPVAGAAGWTYAVTLGFALVYLGEHYVTDLLAGAAIVLAVRKGEPLVDPIAGRISHLIQRLERVANS